VKHSTDLSIDLASARQALFGDLEDCNKRTKLLCAWKAKFFSRSNMEMRINVWSRPTAEGGYVTQGQLYDGDTLVAYTGTEVNKIVGEYATSYGVNEYVVRVVDSNQSEAELMETKQDTQSPAEGIGPYLIVHGDALKGFTFYGPFETARQAHNFNVDSLADPGMITTFEGDSPAPTPVFSDAECALVLRADMICTGLGNVAADAAGKESYHKLSREFSRLRSKMITTTK
jgi:hypothetical protein